MNNALSILGVCCWQGCPVKIENPHFWTILSENFLQNAHVLLCTLCFFIKFSLNLASKLGVRDGFNFNGTAVRLRIYSAPRLVLDKAQVSESKECIYNT